MDYSQLVQEIIAELDEKANPERLAWAKENYPTSLIIKGVTVPNIRPISKAMIKRFKKSPPDEVVAFTKQLNDTRILEAIQIAFEVLEKHKNARRSLTLEEIEGFSEGMDNWVTVDYFAGMLAGPAWREGQIADEMIEAWAVSADRWRRRAAVVCTFALNQKARGGTGDPERTLKICSLVVDDHDDMVTKALSWALRELSKREPEPVIAFVDRHEDRLAKRVVREVRRKIETGRKYD
jgi:3-methyladenine DNA glycosylase AlkD